jgi:hypothetical protein
LRNEGPKINISGSSFLINKN